MSSADVNVLHVRAVAIILKEKLPMFYITPMNT
jgi:hypothetical protein